MAQAAVAELTVLRSLDPRPAVVIVRLQFRVRIESRAGGGDVDYVEHHTAELDPVAVRREHLRPRLIHDPAEPEDMDERRHRTPQEGLVDRGRLTPDRPLRALQDLEQWILELDREQVNAAVQLAAPVLEAGDAG